MSSSIFGHKGGRPGFLRQADPSNLRATSFACHRRIVSVLTIVAIVWSAFRPSLFPISASCRRSSSLSLNGPLIFDRRMRFSMTRYSLRRRSSSSMEPVTLASSFFQGRESLHDWRCRKRYMRVASDRNRVNQRSIERRNPSISVIFDFGRVFDPTG